MATNSLDIEVILDSKAAQKGLDTLKKGAAKTGETFSTLGDTVSSMGGEMNEALGAVGSSIGGLAEGLGGLKSAAVASGGSFSAMLGPIGLVAVGVMQLSKAFADFSGRTAQSEIRIEAYTAATAELTSMVEQLADAGVELTKVEVKRLRVMSMAAQMPINEAEQLNARNAKIYDQIKAIEQLIAAEQKRVDAIRARQAAEGLGRDERALRALYAHSTVESQLIQLQMNREKLQRKMNANQKKADELTKVGSKKRLESTKQLEELMKRSPKAMAEAAERERQLIEQGEIGRLERTKDSLETQRRLAVIESERKVREIKAVEDVGEKARTAAIEGERERLAAQIEAIEKAAADKEKARRAKVMAERRLAAARRLALEKQRLIETARIRRAEIERERLSGVESTKILQKQLELELTLIGSNERAEAALLIEFENKRTVITQQAEAKRKAEAKKAADEERKRAKQRQAFILDSMTFDARMMEEGIDRELELLRLKYERRLKLEQHSQEEITEINRRFEAERLKMLQENADQGFTLLESNLDRMGESLTSSLASGAFDAFTRVRMENQRQAEQFANQFEDEQKRIRESGAEAAEINRQLTELSANYARERAAIRKSEEGAGARMVGDLLLALGKQASVEALMMTAKGFAAMFTNPPASAGFFTAAGIMGAAAVTAGAAGTGLISANPASSGGGGSLSPAQSPSGSPQTAPAPERERADSASMVFNINFGNSTIYDTKRAAQDAMANEIMRTMARRRRGAPRMGA